MSTFAILLAAGESTRMGQNKALLPWQGKSLLEYQIAQLRQTPIKKTIIVLGFEADKLLPLIEKSARVSVVVNPDYPSGRCSSIKAGMKMLPAPSQSVLILAIDQPRPHQLLAEIIKWHRSGDNLITVPVYQGRRGHPPIFSRPLFPELLQVSEETMGLRHILLGHQAQVSELPTSSPVTLIDLNNPGDYKKALSRNHDTESPICQGKPAVRHPGVGR